MSDLIGRVALVTGGGRDVGAEICRSLAAAGAKVAINYHASKTEAEAVATEIKKAGGKAAAYQADVADLEQVRRMVDRVKSDFGGLDILVNNAGFVFRKRFAETQPEEWHKQINACLYSAIHCCHSARTPARGVRPRPDHFDHRRFITGRRVRPCDRSGSPRRYDRTDEIAGARDGSLRRDLQFDLARPDRNGARQDLGRREPRQAGQALSDPAAWPALGRCSDGYASRVRCRQLDHRPSHQHQRRVQHGLRQTAMLHTELIAPVPELLERHAAARPEKVAYWDSTRSVTYSQLASRTASIAARLTKMGVREGDKVALYLPNGVDWIEACFAVSARRRGRRSDQTRRGRRRDLLSSRGCELPLGIHKRSPKEPCRKTVRRQQRIRDRRDCGRRRRSGRRRDA